MIFCFKKYQLLLEKIYSLSKVVPPGIFNMQKLVEAFNHPETFFKSIHVAGTNGKGSVSTKVAMSLQLSGCRVGLFTSPHIHSYRERIQINQEMISEEDIFFLLEKILKKTEELEIEASFFEITTILAFLYFKEKQVDVAVIEAGIGGRLDATNIISPLVSVITSIGYDHMDILGRTLDQIAKEKAGIIKPQTPVVLGPTALLPSIEKQAEKMGAVMYQNSQLEKDYEKENSLTASLVLKAISPFFSLTSDAIEQGLKKMPPFRFERHFLGKEVIFDVAHNAQGFAKLLDKLEVTYPGYGYVFVLGFSKGLEEIALCKEVIEKKAKRIYLVDGEHPRLAKVSSFQSLFQEDVLKEKNVFEGLKKAILFPDKKEVVIVSGSFFLMNKIFVNGGQNEFSDSSK